MMAETWRVEAHRPKILLGGTVPAAFGRAATPMSEGWVAPLFGMQLIRDGVTAVTRAWSAAGRPHKPRILTGRYFNLGTGADKRADHYIRHYYGNDYFALARADTITSRAQLCSELDRLAQTGCDEVALFPCSGDLDQIRLLAQALNLDNSQAPAARCCSSLSFKTGRSLRW
jgi:alkanesulfonate monooxygenase SsuD/methylene tetrahydromethanopterin reductase-like flavin-dependent oxidoreductase (luciferase family)